MSSIGTLTCFLATVKLITSVHELDAGVRPADVEQLFEYRQANPGCLYFCRFAVALERLNRLCAD